MERLDFSTICRLCVQFFQKEEGSPIFNNESYNDKITLPERIKYCSSVEVAEDDGLPPQICNNCLLKLNQSFIFRNQCVLADLTLKRLKDCSFNQNEISNFIKVDIENQIIQSGKNVLLSNIDHSSVVELDNNFKTDESIDEFDNSKNGRHKKSIQKLKSISLQKTEILTNSTKEESEIQNVDFSKEPDKNLTPVKKQKKNLEKEIKKSESLTKSKKPKKLKPVKQFVKIDENDFKKESDVKDAVFDSNLQNENEDSENISEETSEDCNKQISKLKSLKPKREKGLKMHFKKEKPTSYKCNYCQKIYPSEGGWRYHIHTMHNENYQPFICDLCGQAFKVKKNLEAHKNSVHFHLKLHLCDICGRGFASKYALKVHKIWHNDEKNFTCDVCGTKFRTRGKMNTHRSIHGGPKKFMCHICSRDFRWKKDFEIHMRTHTGEKPFKCSHCGKAFASVTNMKKHEKNHLKKLETDTEKVDMMAALPNDARLRRNEFFVFCYGLDDVRNCQLNQISGSIS